MNLTPLCYQLFQFSEAIIAEHSLLLVTRQTSMGVLIVTVLLLAQAIWAAKEHHSEDQMELIQTLQANMNSLATRMDQFTTQHQQVNENSQSESFLLKNLFTVLEEFGALRSKVQALMNSFVAFQNESGEEKHLLLDELNALRAEILNSKLACDRQLQRQSSDFKAELRIIERSLNKSFAESMELKRQLQDIQAEVTALKSSPSDSLEQAMMGLVPFWSEWTEYSTCSASCGSSGLKSRTRTCDTPATRCSGPVQEQSQCDLEACPVWSDWSDYSQCSVSCGRGIKKRTRTCNKPEIGCPGPDQEETSCTGDSTQCLDVLLVAGGSGITAELLSITDDKKDIPCADPVPDLPVMGDWGAFFKHDGHPVFCEAYNDSLCFKYLPVSKTWKQFGKLSTRRTFAATLMNYNGSALITGGKDGNSYLRTSEFWNPEQGQFEPGPALPYETGYHCFARINATHALLTGGYNKSGNLGSVYMLNQVSGQWTALPSLRQKRSGHACGFVNESQVFVAGGYEGKQLSSVEIFDLETQTWSNGPDLPVPIDASTSLQLKDTFLIIGGESTSGSNLDTIHAFNVDQNSWQVWKQKLKVKRDAAPAVYRLHLNYFNC